MMAMMIQTMKKTANSALPGIGRRAPCTGVKPTPPLSPFGSSGVDIVLLSVACWPHHSQSDGRDSPSAHHNERRRQSRPRVVPPRGRLGRVTRDMDDLELDAVGIVEE